MSWAPGTSELGALPWAGFDKGTLTGATHLHMPKFLLLAPVASPGHIFLVDGRNTREKMEIRKIF